MMVLLLIAGIAIFLAGLLGVGFGIPVKEFSFGNTLIVTGVVTACTGMIMLSLWAAVRELKNVTLQLGSDAAANLRAELPQWPAAAAGPRDPVPGSDGLPLGRDPPVPENVREAAPPATLSPPPWKEEAATRERARNGVPPAAEAAQAPRPRRNLLFTSSRNERGRTEARTAEPSAVERTLPPPAPPLRSGEASPRPAFDDARPQLDRSRSPDASPQRRSRAPSTFAEPKAEATGADRYSPAARNEEHAAVTILKSGVVDGMAYSLYSDGSIEAQMPEGMMRFASIDELRAHLDQRP